MNRLFITGCYLYLYAFILVAIMVFVALPKAAQWGARQGQVTAYTETP